MMRKLLEIKHTIFWIIFLLAFFLSSCGKAESTDIVDDSFLTRSPCQPPCWYGLEIGVTSYDEAKTTIKTLPFINQDRVWERQDASGSFLEYSCVTTGKDLCGSLYFDSKNILQSILISQQIKLSLSKSIEQLGEPTGFRIGDYNPGCVFQVYWLQNKISTETIITPDRGNKCDKFESGNIEEDIIIGWINYSNFQPLEEHLLPWP